MRLSALIIASTAAALGAGCDGDVTSLELRVEYSADTCGGGPASSQFFEAESTVSLFVLDTARDNMVMAGDCADLDAEPFRALNDLPRVLDERIDIGLVPFGERVNVQISVHEPQQPCLPYRPGGDGTQTIPKFFGQTDPAIDVSEELAQVFVAMRCL